MILSQVAPSCRKRFSRKVVCPNASICSTRLCRICAGSVSICRVQIQPRKYAPGRADRTAPTRQHELDHTDLPWSVEIIEWGSVICPVCEVLSCDTFWSRRPIPNPTPALTFRGTRGRQERSRGAGPGRPVRQPRPIRWCCTNIFTRCCTWGLSWCSSLEVVLLVIRVLVGAYRSFSL